MTELERVKEFIEKVEALEKEYGMHINSHEGIYIYNQADDEEYDWNEVLNPDLEDDAEDTVRKNQEAQRNGTFCTCSFGGPDFCEMHKDANIPNVVQRLMQETLRVFRNVTLGRYDPEIGSTVDYSKYGPELYAEGYRMLRHTHDEKTSALFKITETAVEPVPLENPAPVTGYFRIQLEKDHAAE